MLLRLKFFVGNKMKKIKLVFIAFVILAGLITLISLLMPSKVMVARTVLIDTTPAAVFSKINNLKTWPSWFSPLAGDRSVVFHADLRSMEWESGGKKNQLLLKDTTHFSSHVVLSREGHNPLDIYFSTDSIEVVRSLQLEMRVVRDLKWYPWEKFAGIVEDNMAGHAYEATLKSLKAFIEKR